MVGDFGGVDVVPLLGAAAIVVCYGGGRRVTANFGGGDVVPFQGQCAMVGGEGDDQLWGSGRGAIAAGCHCRVPISVSQVPSIFRATNFTQTPKKTAMNFVLSFLQTLHCSLHAIWGLCRYNFLRNCRIFKISRFYIGKGLDVKVFALKLGSQ